MDDQAEVLRTVVRPRRRRLRRRDEWEERRAGLSNRLDWYGLAAGEQAKEEVFGLRLAEVRMADVVFAAGAIESYYLRLKRFTDLLAKSPAWKPLGEPGSFTGTPEMVSLRHFRLVIRIPDAYYDFNSMLFWGRSLLHRIDGRWGGEVVEGRRENEDPIGLVEFLPGQDARRIRRLREEMIAGAFRDVYHLASYSLHAFAIPNAGAPMNIALDGSWILPLPDRLGRPPKTGERFTFAEGRHIATESKAIWSAAEDFVSETFEILEAAQLRREDALSEDRRPLVEAQSSKHMPAVQRKRIRR